MRTETANRLPTVGSSKTSLAAGHRCLDCFRPISLCYCRDVPRIENRTSILILQHRREKFHPFNTARMVNRALANCELLADHNERLAERFDSVPLSPDAGLLYPSAEATVLGAVPPRDRPEQLVILDGTWHHAKTLLRDIPRLRSLPRFRLTPTAPGNYRIRREPNDQALSTVEATAAALRELEPEIAGIDDLLYAFDRMIDQQIRRSENGHRCADRKPKPQTTNVPRAFINAAGNLVVAYGESPPGRQSRYRKHDRRAPVYWVAQRLGSGDQFRCAIGTPENLAPEFLERVGLAEADFADPLSIDEFRRRWRAFLQPNDCLVVYHPSTARMLRAIQIDFVPVVVLKSIKPLIARRHGTLDQQLQWLGIRSNTVATRRADRRLANAMVYTSWLQHSLGSAATANEPGIRP